MKRLLMVIVALLAGGLGADVAVTDVVAKQRYPWNGLVDITCQVTGIEGTTNGLNLAVAAVMPETGVVRSLSQVWLVQGGTKTTEREVHTNGTYQLLWDARADLGTVRYTNMVVRVNLDAHEKVQLWEGGPYWATTNLGAEKPEDSGYYFWWGDTVGYKWENEAWVASDGSSSDFSFDSSNTPTYNKSQSTLLSEGWVVSQDGTYVLAPEHDAAQVHWGDAWRMPTAQELDILCYDTNVCDWTWSAQNGVNGYVVRGRGDYAANSIFLPAAGDSDHGTLLSDFNSIGFLWSSVPFSDDNCSWSLDFDWGGHATGYYGYVRYGGKSIRPVQGFAEASFVAGDSAPFLLDTLDSPRIAREVEGITYSPLWGGADSCSVAVNGEPLLSDATDSGTLAWPSPEAPGTYTLTYTAGDETLTAVFKVPVTLDVTDVSFRQRYPWNGLVDIDCTVNCNDPATNISLYVSAKDTATSKALTMRSVWLESDATHTNALEVKSGTHRLVWDAGKDNPNFVSDAVTVEVQAFLGNGLYLVIDLSGGKDAASYPISYLGAEPQGGWTDEYKTTKLVLRRINPGTYTMGSPSDELGRDGDSYSYNEIQHEVTISEPFYMGVFEVTQKQYELVTGSKPSYFSNASCYEARPVEQVSWNTIRGNSSTYNWPSSSDVDPSKFMGKLRTKTGINTLDLPTEAVWEYACRAGTTTALNSGKNLTSTSRSDANMNEVGRYLYNFPSGSTSWSSSSDLSAGTAKVGSYQPNTWGLYDMLGNVGEWTLDWYQNRSSFTSAVVTDPVGPVSGSYRVLRGGSWCSYAGHCRSAHCDRYDPSFSYGNLGLRLCCSAGHGHPEEYGEAGFDRDASLSGWLDLRTGTRIASGSERIAYSPRWGDAASCTVKADDSTIKTATVEGEITWTPSNTGAHTLTHTAGDTTYAAQFTVLGEDVAVHAGALGTSETWRADKVHLVTAAVTVPSGEALTIEPGAVVKFMPGASLDIASGGSCTARGAVFTHVSDDTIGGDTLLDGETAQPVMGDYTITGNITDDDTTEYRYLPPQTLTSNISSDTSLRGYRTYIVSNSVTVASGATLTLQPGTIFKFATGCSLTVNGTLDAQGTRAAPIVFTSLKDDAHGGDTNGDGETTLPNPGDWVKISINGGVANFNYAKILYSSKNETTGAINMTNSGGKVVFANGEIAHAAYDAIGVESGNCYVTNSVIRDCLLAFRHWTRDPIVNCVIYDCGRLTQGGGQHFYNCIFSRITETWEAFGFPQNGTTYNNCCFWNEGGSVLTAEGRQDARMVCGTSGNIWGDPLFTDPDNGDFRIAANSPCVDAGDSSVAPEVDWWGQPRMDVKQVKDTGVPNADGVCPDIGIYEVPGAAKMPLPDLAVVSVATSATLPLAPGETLSVNYVVTNRGAAAATGLVRDIFRFKGADAALGGMTVEAADMPRAYSLAAGACATLTATITVPTLKAGKWKVGVAVNTDNHPYEQNLSNNSAWTEDALTVELEAMANGTQSLTVGKGETAGFALSGLPLSGGVVRVTGAGVGQIAAYGGNGAVPTLGGACACATVALADGSLLVVFPTRAEGENAYLILENTGRAAATVSVEVKETSLALYGASPARIANAGEATITITGSGLSADTAVTLGGRAAKRVDVLNAAQIAATFDVEGLAAGTYGVTAVAVATNASLPEAVEIYAAKVGPKLRAWLEMPSSVRDGRVFTGYVCYANEGDSPMTMPVFKVAREDSNTTFGLEASEMLTNTVLHIGGISPTHPAGVLKAGDAARIPFYFKPFGTYRIKLTHIKDAEDMAAYPTFGGTQAYLAAMSAAATRLNLRGRTAYNVHDFVDQALWEKNAQPCAAASGYLTDAKTGEALANADISLVGTGDSTNLPPATATTDETGYFQLANLADGDYRWLLDGGNTLADVSTNTITVAGQTDLNGLMVQATPGGKISGFVLTTTGEPVAYGTVARLDESGSLVDAVESDGFGAFAFKGLSDGTYSVRAMPKDGYMVDTVTNVLIDAVTRAVEVDFALTRGARLGGVVTFNDAIVTNGTVQAITEDGVSFEVSCATNGVYLFDGLAAGAYTVRYYTNTALSDDVDVVVAVGDNTTMDLIAKERPLFMPTLPVGFGSCETQFIFTDQSRAEGVESWAWDFDSDGVVDSTEASPTWTYSQTGSYSVTLKITEDGRDTVSVYPDCVHVEDQLDTILKEGAVVFGVNSGTLATSAVGLETLALTGELPSGNLAPGMTILGEGDEGWYCRRILTAQKSSGLWLLETENADVTDIYEQYAVAVCADMELAEGFRQMAPAKGSRLMAAKKENNGFSLIHEGGVNVTAGFKPDAKLVFVDQIHNGRHYSKWAFIIVSRFELSATVEGTLGLKYRESIERDLPLKVPLGIPGLSVESRVEIYGEVSGTVKGSLGLNGYVESTLQVGKEHYDNEKPVWLAPLPKPEAKIEPVADIEGSVEVKMGVVPKFGLKYVLVSGTMNADLFVRAALKASLKSPPELTMEAGVDLEGELSLRLFGKTFADKKTPKFEGPRFTIGQIIGPDPDFTYTPDTNIAAPATIQFLNESKGETARFLGLELTQEPEGFEWDFGNGTCSPMQFAMNPAMTYSSEGNYKVYLKAKGRWLTGPYRKKKTIKVGKPEEIPYDPNGGEEEDDKKTDTGKKSWDPNEMVGEEGVGEARYVRPGQELTYTIYFENKAGFDIADAQDVKVTNPLSEWLDWSTFEMREVAFNNQNDVSLDGLDKGSRDIKINGADKYVKASVGGGNDGEESIAETGIAYWRLRVYDPNGLLGWPNDGSGFLPSNDDTHRGEGHLTYRIKVREDAPAGVIITNSASIVFDYNDPIETDPAWWNTVAELAAVSMMVGGEAVNLSLIVGMPYGDLPTPNPRVGHTFGGWFTGPNGTGRQITATSLVESGDGALYAYWMPETYRITFDANGGSVDEASRQVVFGHALGALPVPSYAGHTFQGWFTARTGGSPITESTTVSAPGTYYAQWAEAAVSERVLYPDGTAEATPVEKFDLAASYDGYVLKGETITGTVAVKVAKAGKTGESKVTATVQLAGQKKKAYKGVVGATGRFTMDDLTLVFGREALSGTVGGLEIRGSRNVFAAKDANSKASAAAALKAYKNAYTVAWQQGGLWGGVTVTVGNKGKAKIAGFLPDGTKVSANGQLMLGEDAACVTILSTSKKAPLGFNLWLQGGGATADGLGAESLAAKVGALGGGKSFNCSLLGTKVPVTVAGKKWSVTTDKETALKLTFTPKTGAFKGSFKVGKQKVSVNGVVVNGLGFGSAVIKKGDKAGVTIE